MKEKVYDNNTESDIKALNFMKEVFDGLNDNNKIEDNLVEENENLNQNNKDYKNDIEQDNVKKSSGLPDWLKERFDAGNNFNKENRKNYKYNEVEVYGKKKYVVDSYEQGEEIISRKYTQLADVKESTAIGYLKELKSKYPSGALITDSPFNPKILRGQPMRGQQILEIPVQNKPIPQNIIDYANSNNIIIRDVERNVYNW